MADFLARHWRSADGLSLHARDYAAATGDSRLPVICIHGLTRNARDFEDLAPWIAARGRRVLAVDVRGRGLSDHDPKPARYTPATYARDMLALLDSLGIAHAIFIGTSMGGLIMMMIAGIRLRAIAGAVLNDVGPEVAQAGLDRIARYAGKPVEIRNWDDAAAYLARTLGPAFPDLPADRWPALARRSFSEDVAGVPRLDYDPEIARPFKNRPPPRRSLIAALLFRRLARRRPVLLLRGEISDLLSADIAGRMRRAAPAMEHVEVPRVGHAPLLDEPVALAAIESFLKRLP